jgi:hypothetical protein
MAAFNVIAESEVLKPVPAPSASLTISAIATNYLLSYLPDLIHHELSQLGGAKAPDPL